MVAAPKACASCGGRGAIDHVTGVNSHGRKQYVTKQCTACGGRGSKVAAPTRAPWCERCDDTGIVTVDDRQTDCPLCATPGGEG